MHTHQKTTTGRIITSSLTTGLEDLFPTDLRMIHMYQDRWQWVVATGDQHCNPQTHTSHLHLHLQLVREREKYG